jgi:AraC-like DNA-binding protein
MLSDLFRRHAHLTPGEWLRRMHIRQAASDLLHTPLTIADISESFGFADSSAFQREFIELMRMTPEAYRALDGNREFSLLLPRGYRANEILAFRAAIPRVRANAVRTIEFGRR